MSLANFLFKVESNFSIVYVLFGGFALFVAWAIVFDIDKSVRATGVIVAGSHTQIIQVADGGVLANTLVKAGEKVTKGQLLATLEKQIIQSNYDQIHSEIAYLQAAISRINAQIFNTKLTFSDLAKEHPDFIKSQTSLYLQQKKTLSQKIEALQKTLIINQKILQINQKLLETGDVAQLEVLKNEEKIIEIKGKIREITNNYQQKLKVEKEQFITQLNKNQLKLNQQNDVLKHSEIYAPVDGIVKELKVTTLGGVLKAGEILMEISPTNGGVVLKAKIVTDHIADIKLGMPVSIKLDAFDYAIFGGLEGNISYISSDTLLEDKPSGKQQSFYQVNIAITSENDKIILKLGMSATIEIKTGKRSLFTYLTKPILRGFSGALTEK